MNETATYFDPFAAALAYEPYVVTGTDEQQRRWGQVYDAAANAITAEQRETFSGFEREMNVLVISGVWCGDCVQQCPLIARLAELNPAKVTLRFIDRDEHKEFSKRFAINGGERVPVAIFLSDDYQFCAAFGDRTLHRYRAIARRQLGASCPTGLAAPDADELAATLQDWSDEIERVQLMLRISPRLRTMHGD